MAYFPNPLVCVAAKWPIEPGTPLLCGRVLGEREIATDRDHAYVVGRDVCPRCLAIVSGEVSGEGAVGGGPK
jgi:hypothetical protein